MVVNLIKFADKWIGPLLCIILSVFTSKKKLPKQPKNILAIQLWGIGETICALPALHKLQKAYPKTNVQILATSRNKDVFRSFQKNTMVLGLSPFSIISFMLNNYRKYDIVIDMEEYLTISAIIARIVGKQVIGYRHDTRAMLYDHTVRYDDDQHVTHTFSDLLRPLGIKYDAKTLEKIPTSKQEQRKAAQLIKKITKKGPKKVWAFSPGAAESAKIRMWPVAKWADTIEYVQQHNKVTIVLVGAGDVVETNEEIISRLKNSKHVHNIAGQTSVGEFFALMKHVSLMVSIDSGPMHVSAAQGVPTIGLFCPNTPIRFAPFGNKHISIYKPASPKPVINVHKGEVPNKTKYKHMSRILVSDVISAIKKIKKK